MGCALRFALRVLYVGAFSRFGIAIFGMLSLSTALMGQSSPGLDTSIAVPTDWSHHHLIFSRPGTAEQRARVEQDPRYWQQILRQLRATGQAPGEAAGPETQTGSSGLISANNHRLKRDWSQDMGLGATVGAGQYPAKYAFGATTASCASDFVVFNTGVAGATGQADVIAYNNLYLGCSTTVPAVYWAYDTGGTVTTSVTFSSDGSQVAFVQAPVGGGAAQLVLLKWSASTTETAAAPMVLTNTAVGSYRTCTAPCMTTIAFHATASLDPTPTDSYSAPFYDFTHGSDTLYVGDDAGYLHQFTGVFAGTTPAETVVTTPAAWPVEVATAKLSGPVFDPASGNVFVTTSYQVTPNSGGRLAAVCATSTCAGVLNGNPGVTTVIGTPTPSLVLGPTTTPAAACHGGGAYGTGSNMRLDAPIVDSSAGKVYVFIGNDGNGNSAVIQFSTTVGTVSGNFTWHTCGTESTVGTASTTGIPVFAGSFDNVYFTSASASSPSGNLYVCGNTSADATLYQVRITSNAIAASGTSVLALSTANTTCSPVTEVDNGSTDWIFASVQGSANTASPVKCPSAGGCLMSFSVPTTIAGTLPTGTTATLTATGGTSGVIIDDTVAPGTLHTSQVYFSPLGNQVCGTSGAGGCAVQASQAALQ